MGISIYQYPDDPHIIMREYDNMWTLDEMFESIHQVNNIAESVRGAAFLISTIPALSKIPSGILMRGRSVLGEMSDNIAVTIVVTESAAVQTFYKPFVTLFSRIARQNDYIWCGLWMKPLLILPNTAILTNWKHRSPQLPTVLLG